MDRGDREVRKRKCTENISYISKKDDSVDKCNNVIRTRSQTLGSQKDHKIDRESLSKGKDQQQRNDKISNKVEKTSKYQRIKDNLSNHEGKKRKLEEEAKRNHSLSKKEQKYDKESKSKSKDRIRSDKALKSDKSRVEITSKYQRIKDNLSNHDGKKRKSEEEAKRKHSLTRRDHKYDKEYVSKYKDRKRSDKYVKKSEGSPKNEKKRKRNDDKSDFMRPADQIDILKEKLKLNREKLDACKQLKVLLQELMVKKPTTPDVPLPLDNNCHHLTSNMLEEHFARNISYCWDIINNKIHSDRHNWFMEDPNDHRLPRNESMIKFSSSHIQLLIKCCEYTFRDIQLGHFETRTKYFLNVLLPELCLKIFMDIYEMNYEEATDYLKG